MDGKRLNDSMKQEWSSVKKNKDIPQNIIVINFGDGDEPSQIVFDNREERVWRDET